MGREDAAALARLRADCVLAKEALSFDAEAVVPVYLRTVRRDVTITRSQFEDLIRPAVSSTIDALRRALRSADVEPDDLSAVLLSGGSSRIPMVAAMVEESLGRPVIVDVHPQHTVALGAALLAAEPLAGTDASAWASAPPAIVTAPPSAAAGSSPVPTTEVPAMRPPVDEPESEWESPAAGPVARPPVDEPESERESSTTGPEVGLPAGDRPEAPGAVDLPADGQPSSAEQPPADLPPADLPPAGPRRQAGDDGQAARTRRPGRRLVLAVLAVVGLVLSAIFGGLYGYTQRESASHVPTLGGAVTITAGAVTTITGERAVAWSAGQAGAGG